MRRRQFLAQVCAASMCFVPHRLFGGAGGPALDPALERDWLGRWERSILVDMRNRYCDREMGEELGWLVSPFSCGFYYGYLATQDMDWIDRLVDWSSAWVRRGIKEPDGYIGWPKADGASTGVVPGLFTDNLLGEAMALRPMVMMARLIAESPALSAKYGKTARAWIELSEEVFEKWNSRAAWRDIPEGGVWVVPEFGIDKTTHEWSKGYVARAQTGFTLPANKQNAIALWLLAMHDATNKPIYRERAEKWARVMKSRMRLRENKFYDWNYWDPAGSWDHQPNGQPRHWVGVHPNGGYYGIDVEAIVALFEHGVVFERQDIDRLIATNRDFMWNQQVQGAKFKRLDGGPAEGQWKDHPGVLWTGLLKYDRTLRSIFEANHHPDSWAGLAQTPKYIAEIKENSKT